MGKPATKTKCRLEKTLAWVVVEDNRDLRLTESETLKKGDCLNLDNL